MMDKNTSASLERSAELFSESRFEEILAGASVEIGRPVQKPDLEAEATRWGRMKAMFSAFLQWTLEDDELIDLDGEEVVNVTGSRGTIHGASSPVSEMSEVEFYSVYATQNASMPDCARLVHIQDFWVRENAEEAARDIAKVNGAHFIGFRSINA